MVIYAVSWDEHLDHTKQFFLRLCEAHIMVNLVKTELGCTHVVYLGLVVGQGHVKPVDVKVAAVMKFPIPANQQKPMRFLVMAGHRKFLTCC